MGPGATDWPGMGLSCYSVRVFVNVLKVPLVDVRVLV